MNFVKGLVSINIVTWNSEKYIKECLENCLSQNYNNYEVVVIDNNSLDNTLEICAKYSDRIKIIRNKANLGYSGGHNLGIRSSSAEYVLVLNPDVFLDRNYLLRIVNFLEYNKEYGGAIGKILQYIDMREQKENGLYIDTMGLKISRSRQFMARGFGLPNNSYNTCECFGVDGMAAVYKRIMLEEIKINDEYFDEDFFAYCEDQDLSWRARNAGWKFAFLSDAIAFHVRTWKPKSLKYRKQIKSDIKRRALRNHYLMVLKNDEPVLFIIHFPFIYFRFLKIVVYAIIFEKQTLLAFYDILILIKKIIEKRKIIKKSISKKISIKEKIKWFKLL